MQTLSEIENKQLNENHIVMLKLKMLIAHINSRIQMPLTVSMKALEYLAPRLHLEK